VKRISPATVTVGVMAIVLGLVAAYVVRQALQKPVTVKPAPPPAETVPVVFTLNVIPKHTRLTSRDVFVTQVPKGTPLPAGVFRGVNLVEGRITTETIAAGKPIRETSLLGIDDSLPDLSERIPAGNRAVTITVQGADTGGRRLAEGDHIDITMTVEGSHPDLGEVTTRTLMKNVLIVDAAATGPVLRNARRPAEANSSLITVAVKPAEANKLIVAQRTGTLQATLVSAADVQAAAESTEDIINRRQLLGLKEVPKRFTVEKWSGNSMKIIEMSDERIRESRQPAAARRNVPVSNPASSDNDLGWLSGVKEPHLVVAVGEEASPAPAVIQSN
jgi:pilus assembly protein CpaB